jgi:large subunit ribosomal protein L4
MNGGGVALGPKPRSYAQHTPKKMVRLALLSALSDRADIGRVAVIDDWQIEEPDTRAAVTLLRRLRLKGSVLVVLAQDEIEIALSFRNIPEASITTHAELSAHDVLRSDWLLFSDRTLPTSADAFSGTHEGRVDGQTARAEARAKVAAAREVAEEEEAAPAKKAPAKKAAKATRATKAARAAAEPADATETEADAEAEAEAEAPAKPRRRTRKATAAAAAEAGADTDADAELSEDAVTEDAADAVTETEDSDDDA